MLPVSLFGMAVAAAELPELSSASREDLESIRRRVQTGMARIAFFVAPTVVAYLVIGDLLVAALFRTGEFDRTELRTLVEAEIAAQNLSNACNRLRAAGFPQRVQRVA